MIDILSLVRVTTAERQQCYTQFKSSVKISHYFYMVICQMSVLLHIITGTILLTGILPSAWVNYSRRIILNRLVTRLDLFCKNHITYVSNIQITYNSLILFSKKKNQILSKLHRWRNRQNARLSRLRQIVGSSPGRLQPKTIKLVCVASLLSTQH